MNAPCASQERTALVTEFAVIGRTPRYRTHLMSCYGTRKGVQHLCLSSHSIFLAKQKRFAPVQSDRNDSSQGSGVFVALFGDLWAGTSWMIRRDACR
jgi:hypothetical protein